MNKKLMGLMLLGALATAGCVSNPTVASTAPGDVAPAAAATLHVDNLNFADVDVFVVQDGGVERRIGMVNGNKSADFTLDPAMLNSGQLRLIANPIGANGRANSGPVVVHPGQTVTFTIQPDLRTSSVSVH
ncbi:MAG: hypothetical protein M3081_02560 [Gemmatimonadota bacterium]|nr:hypothetical protein [Gemmatimonadota bacterium]